MKLYLYDERGFLVREIDHTPGNALPTNATSIAPPEYDASQPLRPRFKMRKWLLQDPAAVPEQRKRVPVVISSITPALREDAENHHYVVRQNTDITISGTLNVPNDEFVIPLRRDDGRLFFAVGAVADGAITITIQFPTSGQFVLNTELLNSNLPAPVFTIQPLTVQVVL